RLAAVREAAAASRAVVLLKGADTLVAAPGGGRVLVSGCATPGPGPPASGAVLTGVVAAMLAKGLDPWTAACCGAVMHARAGRIAREAVRPDRITSGHAAEAIGRDGITSADVIEALPGVLKP